MFIARTTTGSSSHGELIELDAIAAVVIGGTLLAGGRGTITGTVLGVLIFTTLTNVFILNDRAPPSRTCSRAPSSSPPCCSSSGWRSQAHHLAPDRVRHHHLAPPPVIATRHRGTSHTVSGRTPTPTARPNPMQGARTMTKKSPMKRTAPTRSSAAASRSWPSWLSSRLHRQRVPEDDDETSAAAPRRPRPGSNDEAGDKLVIGFSAPAADHGWMASITESTEKVAEQYDDVELQGRRGHQRRQRPDPAGRDVHQRGRRRDRAAALRRRGADPGRAQGDGGRHPGRQRRPRVQRPERRARHRARRQLRHGRLGRHLHLRAARRQARRRGRRDRRASTPCR